MERHSHAGDEGAPTGSQPGATLGEGPLVAQQIDTSDLDCDSVLMTTE